MMDDCVHLLSAWEIEIQQDGMLFGSYEVFKGSNMERFDGLDLIIGSYFSIQRGEVKLASGSSITLVPKWKASSSFLSVCHLPSFPSNKHRTIKMTNAIDTEKQPLLEEQREPEREPSLSELQQNVRTAQRAYMRAWSRSTSGKWHKRIMISVTLLLALFVIFCMFVIAEDSLADDDEGWYYFDRVPLEAHIMSKCPDAKDCLHDMILPAMINISEKVDFKLSYIGT